MTARESENIWRLLDANANRAREGLRILEDTARFVSGDAALAKSLRDARHRVDSVVRAHYHRLLTARDTRNDSGRSNKSHPYEGGTEALRVANFKRVQEALRVLEEYGRVLSPGAVEKFQKIRFQVYLWEKQLNGSRKAQNSKRKAGKLL